VATEMGEKIPAPETVGVVIVSAGASTRMAGVDKTLVELSGIPLIVRTVDVFETCDAVSSVVLVVSREDLSDVAEISHQRQWKKIVHVQVGGARRQDSVWIGLKALPRCAWVIVHDGARPLVTHKTIKDGLLAAKVTGAATAAVPVTDTIKVVVDNGRVVETLYAAHEKTLADVTDDASMLEAQGIVVEIFVGDRSNIKVTTRDDLVIAEALLAARENVP
jgi:2-C-methyl-D-erythritol 4-phosphate cytidylyltransferase